MAKAGTGQEAAGGAQRGLIGLWGMGRMEYGVYPAAAGFLSNMGQLQGAHASGLAIAAEQYIG